MWILVALILSILFGIISYTCLYQVYIAYKSKNEDNFDTMFLDFDIFSIPLALVDIILMICKKFFSEKVYRILFYVLTSLVGLIFLILAIAVWIVIPMMIEFNTTGY